VKCRREQRRAERVPFFGCDFPEKLTRLDLEKSREGRQLLFVWGAFG
jgi:hypothetical protein